MFAFLVLFLLGHRAEATADLAAQFSVTSSRSANGLLVSQFSGSQNLVDPKEGYEISVSHDTKPCKDSQDTIFTVELKAPRRPVGRYEMFTDEKSWQEASDSCRQSGFRLADPPETVENLRAIQCVTSRGFSVSLPGAKKYVALGFHYDGARKDFVTTEGKVLNTTLTPWAPHNPQTHHNEGAENCGAMDDMGKLHDVPCDSKLVFVCEKP